jgi:hypothetical protein
MFLRFASACLSASTRFPLAFFAMGPLFFRK